MALPALIEFLSVQRDDNGNLLTHWGMSQVVAVIPASTPVNFTIAPRVNTYANYTFRLMVDEVVVPNVFRVDVYQYGAQAYWSIVYPSSRGRELDYFLRVTHSQPIHATVLNTSLVAQTFIFNEQVLVVSTEQNLKVLDERIENYAAQQRSLAQSIESNRLLKKLASEPVAASKP